MRSAPIVLLVVLQGLSMSARSQIIEPPSGGERGSFIECAFECKRGPNVAGVSTFQEVTTVMLTNQSSSDRLAEVFYFNGKEECLAHSTVELSPVDLDELNVCHSLLAGGVTPPAAGLLEIMTTDTGGTAADGVYGVVKNVLGKFGFNNPEPFHGRVRGIAKFECRVVPSTVDPDTAIGDKCQPSPPDVTGILVEGTHDTCDACNADFNNDGVVDAADFDLWLPCFQNPGACTCGMDLDDSGSVDATDFTIFQCQFTSGVPGDPACCP